MGNYSTDDIFFWLPSFCWNRKGATSAEICSVIIVPSSIKSGNMLCGGRWWIGVIVRLPFCLYQRCLWMEMAVGRGQTTAATAMASFQRCIWKPERRRQQQRHREPGKLFYIIPRHNRDNLSVCAHTYTERRGSDQSVWGFFKVHMRNISLDFPEYRFHGKKKKSASVRFTFAAFSAISSNYNNELWRSSGTQTPRELAWYPPCIRETAVPGKSHFRGASLQACPCRRRRLNMMLESNRSTKKL